MAQDLADPISACILVVDDEIEILELLGEYLRARGFRVFAVDNGQDAVDILATEPVDVVLTDMKMPVLGGLQLLTRVRNGDRPVAAIVMTGFGTVETAIQAMKDGASDYLLKPFRLRDVHEALARALDRLRLDREARRMSLMLEFFETAHRATHPPDLMGLWPATVRAACAGTEAAGAAVWLAGQSGWQELEVVGQLDALDDPTVLSTAGSAGARSWKSFRAGSLAGAVLVSRSAPLLEVHAERLALVAGVVQETLARVHGAPSTGG